MIACPIPDFFYFCETLLDRYAYEEQVSVITGQNLQFGRHHGRGSYYFSKYPHCWGWATWRRSWHLYCCYISFLPQSSQSDDFVKKTPDRVERRYWGKIFDKVRLKLIDSWAYPWMACVWHFGGLTATPNVNLVSNIGFGTDSTHTASIDSPLAFMSVKPIDSLEYLPHIEQNQFADLYVFDNIYGGNRMKSPFAFAFVIFRLFSA